MGSAGRAVELSEDVAKQTLTLHVKKEPIGGTQTWEQIVGRFVPAHVQVIWDYAQLQPNG